LQGLYAAAAEINETGAGIHADAIAEKVIGLPAAVRLPFTRVLPWGSA
jgi:hypothetical protein